MKERSINQDNIWNTFLKPALAEIATISMPHEHRADLVKDFAEVISAQTGLTLTVSSGVSLASSPALASSSPSKDKRGPRLMLKLPMPMDKTKQGLYAFGGDWVRQNAQEILKLKEGELVVAKYGADRNVMLVEKRRGDSFMISGRRVEHFRPVFSGTTPEVIQYLEKIKSSKPISKSRLDTWDEL